MEFFVHIEQNIPPEMDPARLAELKAAEHARGRQLAEAGKMRRIWRDPGRRAVYALYECGGPDELHGLLASLPLFPWMDIDVITLGTHALDPVRTDGNEGENG